MLFINSIKLHVMAATYERFKNPMRLGWLRNLSTNSARQIILREDMIFETLCNCSQDLKLKIEQTKILATIELNSAVSVH